MRGEGTKRLAAVAASVFFTGVDLGKSAAQAEFSEQGIVPESCPPAGMLQDDAFRGPAK